MAVDTADGKKKEWTIESNAPSSRGPITKRRMEAAVGTKVTIYISPARDGSALGFFDGIDFADGSQWRRTSGVSQ